MTNEQKRMSAERLFDAIGMIDDRYIAEADSAYIPAKRTNIWKKAILAAVAVTLALSVMIGSFLVASFVGGYLFIDKVFDALITNKDESDLDAPSATLSEKLVSIKDKTEDMRVSEDSIDLFSGSSMVIWKYSDEADYRVSLISDNELVTLQGKLERNRGESIDSSMPTDTQIDGVWIALGDGRVISPYLEQTAGNVGYGQIFDYTPEYEPSDDFAEYLCDSISK